MRRLESSTCFPPASRAVFLQSKHNKADKIHADRWADKGSVHLKASVRLCVCVPLHKNEGDMDVSEGLCCAANYSIHRRD